MADYNVNMKKWNGRSCDNVLPLAYNAKQLEGQSLAKIKQWVHDNGVLLYTGQEIGTGTYGYNNPTSITFPFEPIILIGPVDVDTSNRSINISNYMKTSYEQHYWFGYNISLKISEDRKTISWYSSSRADEQLNASGLIYYYAAIGGYDMGGQTEWTITSSGTWIVPKTGRYYIELYGYGGAGQGTRLPYASGGASCQSYDSVVLTTGQVINVNISLYGDTPTSFGSYTVANGGKASLESPYYGVGIGNKGKNGAYSYTGHTGVTVGNGVLSANHGVGQSSQDPYGATGRSGAVYIKYLGA